MPKIICTLPYASTLINGVNFVAHRLGVVSEEIEQHVADAFLSIEGYVQEDGTALTTSASTAPGPTPTTPSTFMASTFATDDNAPSRLLDASPGGQLETPAEPAPAAPDAPAAPAPAAPAVAPAAKKETAAAAKKEAAAKK